MADLIPGKTYWLPVTCTAVHQGAASITFPGWPTTEPKGAAVFASTLLDPADYTAPAGSLEAIKADVTEGVPRSPAGGP